MEWSRRQIGWLLPALAQAQSSGQGSRAPSLAFRFDDLKPQQSGTIISRQILSGETHSNFLIDLHETELGVGLAPHDPHRHVHEEMVLIRDGELEVTISGKVTRLNAGSGAYIASNELHGWRNVGTTPARYFVLALGRDNG